MVSFTRQQALAQATRRILEQNKYTVSLDYDFLGYFGAASQTGMPSTMRLMTNFGKEMTCCHI